MATFVRPAPPVVEQQDETGGISGIILLVVAGLLGLAGLAGADVNQSDAAQSRVETIGRTPLLFAECDVMVANDLADDDSPHDGFDQIIMLCPGD